MMITRSYTVLLLWFVIGACGSLKKNTGHNVLEAKDLLPYGRTTITDNKLELISSAVHFGFSFEGKVCDVYTSLPAGMNHNYLQYELDGVYQRRIKIPNGHLPFHLTASTTGKHTVWIYKATEAITGPVFIEKLVGSKLTSLPNSNAPLIEFIGNSITCGADADTSDMRCGAGEYHDYHNAYYAYGPRVARMVGANYILSSVSGIGIYRTWNHEKPSMPEVYEKTDFQVNDARSWDFSKYHPQIVSIALGTNDLSNGDGKTPRSPFDSSKFVNNYISFVQLLKSKYRDAQIVLLNSPMVSGERNVLLENCLQTIKMHIDHSHPSDKPVSLFFFKPMKAGGCAGHPSVQDHMVLADELYPFLKGLIEQEQ
jgi:lysophospholipase L1-like esterase